jgi:nucleotide-binding universal stress UspA family protein
MLKESQIYLHNSALNRKIERILCPTDLSPDSDEALRYGIALTRAYGAKLLVCHCVEESQPNLPGHIKGLFHIKKLFEESIGPYVSLGEFNKLDWEGIVVEGKTAETIVREAAERHVDLIVMRSRRRPYTAALLGSTAESVCRTAPCPVLVTHSEEREWVNTTSGKINLKRILVAHDFSDYSELSLSYALSLAQEYQTELHLLHILPVNLQNTWYPMSDSAIHRITLRLQRAVPAESQLWCKHIQAVREGKPYQEILSYAEENEIDLVCMGAHGTEFGKWALFGSNADRVLRQARCPVFIARPLKPTIVEAVNNKKSLKAIQGD